MAHIIAWEHVGHIFNIVGSYTLMWHYYARLPLTIFHGIILKSPATFTVFFTLKYSEMYTVTLPPYRISHWPIFTYISC